MEDDEGHGSTEGGRGRSRSPLRPHGGSRLIAVDTNVLVYATTEDARQHERAKRAVGALAEGPAPWGIPVFCLGEFLRVTTHPRVLTRPFNLEGALEALDRVLESPSLHLLRPGMRFWSLLQDVVADGQVTGNRVFDAQIVAVCLEHAVDTILSEDRGLRRFTGVRLRTLADATEDDTGR